MWVEAEEPANTVPISAERALLLGKQLVGSAFLIVEHRIRSSRCFQSDSLGFAKH